MPDDVHNVLVIEDDAEVSRRLVAYVRGLGMRARVAATLEEVDAALAEETFCCVLLDKQIPASLDLPPLAATGDLAQRRIRAIDARRTGEDHHVLPILVITGAAVALDPARAGAFVSKSFRDGASAYIPKPFDADTVTGEILAALERAGRREHAQCAGLRPTGRGAAAVATTPAVAAVAKAPEPLVMLDLDGLRVGRRTTFLVNGKRRDVQDWLLVGLLRLAAERSRGSIAWLSRREVGYHRSLEAPSRVQQEVADAIPEGFELIQRAEEGVRLHPLVGVARIDWGAFERHRHPGVQAVAVGERKRRE